MADGARQCKRPGWNTYRRIVEGRRADGIIVVRARRDDARIRYLLTTDTPFVVMGRSDVAGDYSLLDGDGTKAFSAATERLLALGHRRIVHLAAPSAFTFATLRRNGYEGAMLASGLQPVSIESAAESDAAYAVALQILAGESRPTAPNTNAEGKEQNRRIEAEISVEVQGQRPR